jgi:hypothetical protein
MFGCDPNGDGGDDWCVDTLEADTSCGDDEGCDSEDPDTDGGGGGGGDETVYDLGLVFTTEATTTVAPTTGTAGLILTAIGASLRALIAPVVVALLTPAATSGTDTLSSNPRFWSPEYIEANCTPVGAPVVVPSTKRGNKGGQSIEQEYLCPDGSTWTIHTLTDPKGKPIDKHGRPNGPKYGGR